MKFLVVLCLLAAAAADDDKLQDKKTQSLDTQNNSLNQPATSLLNSQVFSPAAAFPFPTTDPSLQVANLAYSGYTGNVSPIQAINPDFLAAAAPAVVNTPIPTFPVTRTVLPTTTAAVNGIQSAFPVAGNVFPAVSSGVGAIPSQFPVVGTGILSAVNGLQGVATGTPSAPATNAVIQTVPAGAYRFLTPSQGLQPAQQIGLAAIPAFTSGILGTNVLQGQNIPAGLDQILSNPAAGGNSGNISGFRQA